MEQQDQLVNLEHRLNGILKCVVCLELPKAATFQCRGAHLICAACFTHLLAEARLHDVIATCPICLVEISLDLVTRNIAVQKAVCELPTECKFCKNAFPRRVLDTHELNECNERLVFCKYMRIGCEWSGHIYEKNEHELNCRYNNKTGYEIMDALKSFDKKVREDEQVFKKLVSLLSYDKVSFIDINMKIYSLKDGIYYMKTKIAAFDHQWKLEAKIDANENENEKSTGKTLSYRLVLKSKTTNPMNVYFFMLKGPFSNIDISHQIYKHVFTEQNNISDYFSLSLTDNLEFERLVAEKATNLRLVMCYKLETI